MSFILFHQNMKVFGGQSAARNAAYQAAFAGISAGLAIGDQIAVAGFTEVTSYQAINAFNGVGFPLLPPVNLCNALIGGANVLNIACGITTLNAVAGRQNEYITLGINAALNIISVGRIIINTDKGFILHDDNYPAPFAPGPFVAWCQTLPAYATLDYRNLVYVVAQLPPPLGQYIVVGFLHNLYTLETERAAVATQIPKMIGCLQTRLPGAGQVYIGGDFNLDPLIRGSGRPARGYPYSEVIPVGTVLPAPPPGLAAAAARGTTWTGSTYDYWYSTIVPPPAAAPVGPFITPIPTVNVDTLSGPANAPAALSPMSDHVSILLQIT